MAVKTDAFGIGHTHVDKLLDPRYQTLCGRIPGMSDVEPHIRKKHSITVAGVKRKIRSMVHPHLVEFIHPLGKKVIKINEHRITFALFIIGGLDQDSLQGNTVNAVPFHKLRCSPCKFIDLGIDLGDLFRLRKFRIGNPKVGKLLETLLSVHQNVGFFGLGAELELFVLFQEFCDRPFSDLTGIKTMILFFIMVGGEPKFFVLFKVLFFPI